MGQNQTKHGVSLETLERRTQFNKKTLLQWYEDFMNVCPAGRMTKGKFQLVFNEFFPSEDPFQLLDHVFNVFNELKDGVVNFSDFVRILHITANGTPEEKLNLVFKLYDINNDEIISKQDMLNVVKGLYRWREANERQYKKKAEYLINSIFEEFDKNNTNMISREDFIQGFLNKDAVVQRLTRIDTVQRN